MTAPFPDFATPGGVMPTQVADQLFGHFTWMARWSEEITTDVDLDLKKLAQLSFIHCRLFASLVPDPVPADIVAAVRSRFAADGIEWPTNAAMGVDLLAIKAEAQALFEWVRDFRPEARVFAERTYDEFGTEIEVVKITSPKPQPVHNRVASLRALYT